jgi:WD40 repeat protein
VLWDVDGRQAPRRLYGHLSWVGALAFAPDGKTLASGGAHRSVILWDVASMREARRIETSSARVTSLAFAPDGKTLVIAGVQSLELWDMPSLRLRAGLDVPRNFRVLSVAYAPDGRTLAAAGDHRLGGWMRLYNLADDPPSLRADLTLERPGPAFSPDSLRVAAVGQRAIGFWDINGTQRDFIERRSVRLEDRVMFSPDGRWLGIIEMRNASLIDLSPLGP